MLKLLRLLMLLSGNRRYTLAELMQRFDQSDRTIYRHLEEIESAGFVLNRTGGTYQLQTDNPAVKSLRKLLHFSEEEAYVLYKTIALLQGTSPIKDRLAGKLNALYDFRALSLLPGRNSHEAVSKLGEAIREDKQVMLKAYRSGNSDSITDRTVEPFDFLTDYSGVWCYDPESGSSKQFKIARIEEVEVLPMRAAHHARYSIPFTDAFRMSAPQAIATIKATLTLKAYNLLLEEFPLAENYVQAVNGHYHLQVPVADYNGIGRFALGLPGEVKVNGPEGFVVFLKERVKYFLG
ncbi:MAG: WYL domain-containing protein [Sediminibacterium sp.]|nr:WYL domain-containing protein [Sediminibacterium sp.]